MCVLWGLPDRLVGFLARWLLPCGGCLGKFNRRVTTGCWWGTNACCGGIRIAGVRWVTGHSRRGRLWGGSRRRHLRGITSVNALRSYEVLEAGDGGIVRITESDVTDRWWRGHLGCLRMVGERGRVSRRRTGASHGGLLGRLCGVSWHARGGPSIVWAWLLRPVRVAW